MNNEPNATRNKPDGYYLIGQIEKPEWCLIYLYAHADFDGVRRVAFGQQDGGGSLSVLELITQKLLREAP